MSKRIIFIFVILYSLSALSCCGRAEITEDDTLNELYSVSNAFLKVHYSATVRQAEEYAQLNIEIENARPSLIPDKNVYFLEEYAPDLAERYKALIKQKYQTQPLTDKGFDSIELNTMSIKLWKVVLSKGSDIEVTSVKTSLRNTDINNKRNDIMYTVNLLIDKTTYEVTGVLGLVLVDGKWQIDAIQEFGWSPSFPE